MVQVPTEDARAYAAEVGMLFYETSAKTAVNINELFREIGPPAHSGNARCRRECRGALWLRSAGCTPHAVRFLCCDPVRTNALPLTNRMDGSQCFPAVVSRPHRLPACADCHHPIAHLLFEPLSTLHRVGARVRVMLERTRARGCAVCGCACML